MTSADSHASTSDPLTVVMYHYVRPLAESSYPAIRGLELADFEGQLDYIARHYHFVSLADVVDAVRRGRRLPPRPLLLTFDDGYVDHHRYVLPALIRRGARAAFFPPAGAVLDRSLLDVNRIHFLLASRADHSTLVREIEAAVDDSRQACDLDPLEAYRARFWAGNRFDSAEDLYIKRMLQLGLPQPLRQRIARDLFRQYVTRDEAAFADDLYMSIEQLSELRGAGMDIGGHGYAHAWLGSLSRSEQAADIDRSLDMLARLGLSTREFSFCYPFGSYTDDTLDLLESRGCVAAFTTRVALAQPSAEQALQLPRIDTNDLPVDGLADPVTWTTAANVATSSTGA